MVTDFYADRNKVSVSNELLQLIPTFGVLTKVAASCRQTCARTRRGSTMNKDRDEKKSCDEQKSESEKAGGACSSASDAENDKDNKADEASGDEPLNTAESDEEVTAVEGEGDDSSEELIEVSEPQVEELPAPEPGPSSEETAAADNADADSAQELAAQSEPSNDKEEAPLEDKGDEDSEDEGKAEAA
jgi:hypothetical protein